jgi:hypothetical protein
MASKKKHEPITIAIVREIAQKGYCIQVQDPVIRADGWLFDRNNARWYSPENVLSVTTFEPRAWDGNGLKSGMLCLYNSWLGVTSERPSGMEKIPVVLISRDAKRKLWTVLINGAERLIPERSLEPAEVRADASA